MDNLPPAGFQFAGDDYGPVDFPSSLSSDMQAGINFAGGGPVFPQNQRGTGYTMSPFHMNYSQQSSMAAMTGLPTGTFRSRFSDYPPDQSPHLPMPIPSSAAAGMISDRLPSFSTIVSSSGTSTGDIVKSSQALYTSMSAQQLAFPAAGGRGNQGHFDANNFADQMAAKGYNKSPSLGSASPGMVANYPNNIPHSSIMQHASHNGGGQHLSPRSYKDDINQQQYISAGMHIDRPVAYGHGGVTQNAGESMTLPKFKHKFLSHNQQQPPRRTVGPFKFFIIGKTERPSIFNKGTQTSEESMGELKIKIPKREIFQPESDDFSDDEPNQQKRHKGVKNKKGANASPRITFPYDPLPNQGGGDFRGDFQKNSKLKTVISPSFVDSAGKATMTTCVANKATIVTVGIVSRPQGMGDAETTHSSKKGVMATGGGYQNTPKRGRGQHNQNAENFEQLMQERKAKARDLEQERMEVSVRIDDTQYIQVGNSKRWQCNECDKSYTTKHNLVMHVLDHSGIKPHLCLKCGKYFKQLSHLNTHMLTHDKIKPHTCNMCGKGFTQISHLKRHLAVSEKNGYCANLRSKRNSGQSPVTSPQVQPQLQQPMMQQPPQGKRFSDQGQMANVPTEGFNDEDSKDPNEGGRLLCRYCDRKFRYPSQLKDHMQTHNGSRPYMCTECGMDFMKEHHLKAHQFTHTGLKPYTCDICGRSFNQRANLQRHKLIHDTNRTYKCNICNKQFTQPQTLKAHQVVHADRKPFECNICGKEFGRYHNLQGHMHMHSNTKPYVCFCGSTFTLKGNLNRHKKVKHGLNETTDVMEEDAVNFLSSLSERARDDYNADGSLSPGSGGDSMDGKFGRKGRKSIPRKITQGEGGDQSQGQLGVMQGNDGNLILQEGQPQEGVAAGGGKPFVIQNPDTDDEQEEGEEEGEIVNPHGVKAFEDLAPMTSVMNFQPLNVQGEDPRMSMKRPHEDEGHDQDKRPRRQSQRRSPKIQSDVDQEDSDGYDGETDHADADWIPGSKKKSRVKSDA
ncbi:zinc finger protein 366 [Elysia marginata]|uniref:Zinc finger protein 366 n=1 Tax=Elysia marginata TaxID=1093978 RepID=A0AAV4F7I6_9GAST|nr:zinc finger protein 366 [Elysia marginata]